MGFLSSIGRTFRRSALITQITLRITFQQDPELLLFPGITLLFVLGSGVGTYFATSAVADAAGLLPVQVPLIALAVAALLLPVGVVFATFCTTRTVQVRLHGGDASLWQSLGFGLRNLHRVLLWVVVSTGAFLVLGSLRSAMRKLAKNLGPLGQMLEGPVMWVLETAWRISRLLVVPAMVYEGVGAVDGIKTSVSLIRDTWGQSLIRDLGFEAVFGAVKTVLVLLVLACVLLLPAGSALQAWALVLVGLGFAFAFVLEGMLASVFNAAMYHFATRREAGLGFSKDILRSAMRSKGAQA
ncbi:MAG: DUF6159 family protein [Myxococcota bacterium]